MTVVEKIAAEREPAADSYAFINRHLQGPYYVKYNDGEVSGLMNLRTARSYASIFGGTVARHSAHPTFLERWRNCFCSTKAAKEAG